MRHLLLPGLLLAVLAGAGAYQLAYKDTAGAVRWYRTDIAITGKFTVAGSRESFPMTGSINFVSQEKVVAVNDNGDATISTKITDGELHMSVEEEEMTQSLVDYTVIFTRSPSGKVSGMRVAGNPLDATIETQPLGFGGQWRLISGIGRDIEFPPKDIKAGAKWSQNSTLTTLKTSISNILREPKEAGYLSIDSRTTIKIPSRELEIPMEDQTITAKQSAEMTAESGTKFDAEKGELVGADFTGDLKVTVILPDPDKPITLTGLLKLTGAAVKIPEPTQPEQSIEPAGSEEPAKE